MWWITVSLILVGIILMLVEMLLVPGVGVAGFASFLALGASCWYTFTCIGTAAGWWITSFVIVLLIVMIVVILRSRTWRKFELKTEVDSKVNEEPELVKAGERGVALTRLAPRGTGRFGSVSCEVKSADNSMVDAGTPLEIVSIEDNQVIVKPII